MKVFMLPSLAQSQGRHGGISRVIESYHEHAPKFGIEYVNNIQLCDLFASHAGAGYSSTGQWPDVVHSHGFYWSNDYPIGKTHLEINRKIIEEIRHAKETTVPSPWVAKTFQRDMRFSPTILPHGIDWEIWQGGENHDFVLWNKNRPSDACTPEAVTFLAEEFPSQTFVSTFIESPLPNVEVTGALPFAQMMNVIKAAGIYLSTARETFGIGCLEAMASGSPVLGWNYGGNRSLIKHGHTGYLAEPGNWEDLAQGLEYCQKYRIQLGENARESARHYTWDNTMEILVGVYKRAMKGHERPMFIDESAYKIIT